MFDPQTNMWTDVAPTSVSSTAISLTALQGKLYTVCKAAGSDNKMTVEAYDAQLDRWEPAASAAVTDGDLNGHSAAAM